MLLDSDDFATMAKLPFLNENTRSIYQSLIDGKLARAQLFANKIEAGNATGDEDESIEVYDLFVDLMNTVVDLVGMCRRREEIIAALQKVPA